ncbi:FtsH protease activity modulator HflK [Candidatus Spongiihabitans sp.]|uniref:FtsH protease activity modulator HflK n=1 Tax=Candidatus Spongiihabitans sp. TaxID=3101308 RepID=UPI003C7A04A5
MPWNESGSNRPESNQSGTDGNNDDPWNQRGNQRGNQRNRSGHSRQQRPPDLDEMFRQAKERIDNLFGRRTGGGGGNGDSRAGGGRAGGNGLIILLLVIGLGFWVFTGVYTVDQGEQAIELRFGKYTETNDAGLHWHIPTPFESVEIVNTQNVNTVEVGYRKGSRSIQSVPREALMLTQDENIIDIHFAVQYDIKDPTDLLFNVSEYNSRDLADSVVRQATESAVREIVGRNTMDFAITEGRAQLASEAKSLVQDILDRYQTGINVRTVEMQNAQPPEQVKDAFDDVVRAREDEQRLKNLAEAYANDIIPKARGFSARILQEADAYKASIIAKADGETARFDQVLSEYSKAPDITRDRLYLETMEQVFSRSSKMIIDQQSGGNTVMYLPLDQLLKNRSQLSEESGLSNQGGVNRSAGNQVTNRSLRSTDRSVDRTVRQ